MKRPIFISALILLSGCSFTPPPMKYMAADMPINVTVSNQNSEHVEVTKHKFGILYRKPQDVGVMVRELQKKANGEVLRTADVRIRTPSCLKVFCYAYDTAFAGISK